MPEIVGRLRPPRLAGAAPASPALGEMYFDTDDNTLYWWSGTAWVAAKDAGGGGGTAEVNISTAGPSPRVGELLWVDTDDPNGSVPTFVTALPASPVDGQEVYYLPDSTTPVVWHFRYRAGSPNLDKWEFLGGPPLVATVSTGETVTGTAYTTGQAATPGPGITLPLNGSYDITVMATITTAAVSGNAGFASMDCGTTGANDAWAAQVGTPAAVANSATVQATTRLGISGAQLAILMKYRSSVGSAGTITVARRRLSILPVAVGRTS